MLKKLLALLIIGLVFNLATAQATFAGTKEEKFAAKVKSNIIKIGTGPEAKIEVKLKDKTKLKGYVSEANEEQFVIVDAAGQKVPVAYSQVKQAKGNNLSQGVVFAIVLGALIGLVVIVIAVVNSQGGG